MAEFVAWFRSPHARTADAEQAWDGLTATLDGLAVGGSPLPGCGQ
ncbi:hypothetical protein ACFQYP_04290 [Nonomuraea antimicrobica]